MTRPSSASCSILSGQGNNGEVLGNKFWVSLQGTYQSKWDRTIQADAATVGASHDVPWFDGLVADLQSYVFDEEDWHSMQNYLKAVLRN
jgi:hypothetical protein